MTDAHLCQWVLTDGRGYLDGNRCGRKRNNKTYCRLHEAVAARKAVKAAEKAAKAAQKAAR